MEALQKIMNEEDIKLYEDIVIRHRNLQSKIRTTLSDYQ
jgi:hypothetical protein